MGATSIVCWTVVGAGDTCVLELVVEELVSDPSALTISILGFFGAATVVVVGISTVVAASDPLTVVVIFSIVREGVAVTVVISSETETETETETMVVIASGVGGAEAAAEAAATEEDAAAAAPPSTATTE